MLYYLFDSLEKSQHIPGAGLFQYYSFRAALALLLSLFISLIFGKKIIKFLQKKQIGESVRDLGLAGQVEKAGTPTMGGIIIILATIIPTLLVAKLGNIYIIMLLVTTIWMGIVGFLDDYVKVFQGHKDGMNGRFKIMGQLGLGIFIGATMYFHPDITIKEEIKTEQVSTIENQKVKFGEAQKSLKTTVPFMKSNEFDYGAVLKPFTDNYAKYSWLVFIPFIILIIIAVSNGANLTDGLDGLAAGSSVIMLIALGLFAWVSGNIIFSSYLNIMYIPNSGEITIFLAAFAGALIGFLWYNTYPAQVFMGDTGSLTIGGIIAVIAIIIRKELLIPLLAGIFLIENLSVIIQVFYFKYTKKMTGTGKRVFLMSPLHHHYQKKGIHESKIVSRFWIVGIMLAVLSIIMLKLR
jgi:phospho-N-acetylmuramoyl-pentapeptide-transferase